MANGFANRFLWVLVQRSKLLPEGGSLTDDDLAPIVQALQGIKSFATFGPLAFRLPRSDEFSELWRDVYVELTDDRPGMLGAILGRAEAQVLRLSLIYAVLDRSLTMKRRHLEAALAVWRYCERSAEIIFGEMLGDPIADDILAALRRVPGGLTRTEINGLFGGHRSSGRIGTALTTLLTAGLAVVEIEPTPGRSVERWSAVRNKRICGQTQRKATLLPLLQLLPPPSKGTGRRARIKFVQRQMITRRPRRG